MSAVYNVAHRNAFHRKDNIGYPSNPESEARLVEAIKRRDDYAIRLARKHGVGKVKTNRLAHEILETRQFRPGLSKPVLSSTFPQKHYDPKMGKADEFAEPVKPPVSMEQAAPEVPVVSEPPTASAPEQISASIIECAIQIIERILEWTGGKMPSDRAALVGLILTTFAVPENVSAELRGRLTLEQWRASQASFALALVIAIDCIQRQRKAAELGHLS